ncbi:RNA-binding protein 44 [Anableps anableps]
MLPSSKNDAVWTASSGELRFLTNPTSAAFLAGWPAVPATVYYEEPVPPSVYGVVGCPAMLEPPRLLTQSVTPPDYLSFCEHSKRRALLLHRSVLDLLAAHHCLALTDTELLRWYLSLSPEDRSIILDDGGLYYFLQNHPCLELSQGHDYVKKTCLQMLEMLPGDMMENLPQVGCSNSMTRSQKQLREEAQDKPAVHQMASNLLLTQGQNQQKLQSSSISAAVSLDVDLESARQRRKAEFWSQELVAQSQRAASTIQAQSERPVENSKSSEQPRLDTVKITRRSDESQLQQAPPLKGPAGENVLGGENTADNHVETRLGLEDESESDQFHSTMEDDSRILMCLASNDLAVQNAEAPIQPVSVSSDPPATIWEALHVKSTAEKFTSTGPCEPSCEAAVNTEVETSTAKQTQTEGPNTAEQNIMTELHMSDLDYLAEEFIKIQILQERREPKKKSHSPGNGTGASRKDCSCKQQAEQAELTLLSLHYELCRQYVWRLYYTSAEGHLPITIAKDLPPNVIKILQKLETDYNLMKHQILMGVPLERLSPLCVECEKITTGACYIPEQIIGDVVGKAPSWYVDTHSWCSRRFINSSPLRVDRSLVSAPTVTLTSLILSTVQGTQKHDGAEDSGSPEDEDRKSCQKTKLFKKEADEVKRSAALVPDDRFVKQMGCEEVSFSEAWYDAEEELQGPGPAENMADNAGSASDESSSSVLYVSNLSGHVTQSDVRQLFEKFQPSDVSIFSLKNDVRVAIVIVDGSEAAKAAVIELNGHRMHNQTLFIRHLSGAAGGGHPSASTRGSMSLQDAPKAPTSETSWRLTEKKLINPPVLSSSIQTRKVVSIFPTAKGTCVPQHFGTMDGLDTLMAELSQLHRDVHRQTILDALMELKTMHQGVLASLPLSTIRDMTSDLLTKSAARIQI